MATRNTVGHVNLAEKATRSARQLGAPGTGTPFFGQLIPAIIVAQETATGPYSVSPVGPDGEALSEATMFPVQTWPEEIPLNVGAQVFVQWNGDANPSFILMSAGVGGLGTTDTILANRFFSS